MTFDMPQDDCKGKVNIHSFRDKNSFSCYQENLEKMYRESKECYKYLCAKEANSESCQNLQWRFLRKQLTSENRQLFS